MRMLLVSLLAGLVLAPDASAGFFDPSADGRIRVGAVTQLAAEIAGRPIDIGCEAPLEWASDPASRRGFLAYTWFQHYEPTYVVLGPYVCGGLVLTIADPAEERIHGYTDRRGTALLAVVHESMHVRYRDRNEAMTECRTLKALPDVAARLHTDVQKMMDAAIAYDRTLPAAYHGAAC